jgi:hypothetical protein
MREARKKLQTYRCFLVRCRLEESAGPAGEPGWRFTVQEAGTDAARRSFASFHDVAAYIDAELASCGAFSQDKPGNKGVSHG